MYSNFKVCKFEIKREKKMSMKKEEKKCYFTSFILTYQI